MLRRSLVIFAAIAACLVLAAPAGAQGTLRIVMHSDLKVIDPIWASAQISRTHGYLVYDTLFGLDDKFRPQPQMVERYETSPDGLVWTFTLRSGLAWHDGLPVTAEDCVASIKRWGSRDPMGLRLLSNTSELVVLDAKTLRLTLKAPFALVLETLAKPGGTVPFMMPRRIAETPITTQIRDATGSGPYIFKAEDWRPGEKAVYVRNPNYRSRTEPSSNFAGAKAARLERIEWVAIPDSQTAISALSRGEVDAVETITHDLLPIVERNGALQAVRGHYPNQFTLRPNWLHAPLNDARIREAIGYALDSRGILEAQVGDARFYTVCRAYFGCGTDLASEAGLDDRLRGHSGKARALLEQAGYDGTPVVLLRTADIGPIASVSPVVKTQLERAGFKVDMQSVDWQSQIARVQSKQPPNERGWSLSTSSSPAIDVANPVVSAFLNTNCSTSVAGWPCDAGIEELRSRFARESDADRRRDIAADIQARAVRLGTHFPLGEWFSVAAYSRAIQGLSRTPAATTFWNMEKR